MYMIRLIQQGEYELIESKSHTTLLVLDNRKVYAWIHAKAIGEILVTAKTEHTFGHLLAIGNYRVYKIDDDLQFSDQVHLELSVGRDRWQGYLLPKGLPTKEKKRNRIIPTKEIVSKNISNGVFIGIDD